MLELTNQNFEKEVLKKEGLFLVDFWRPGCGPCLVIEPIIQEIAKEFEGKIKVGKVNIFENSETADKYKIPATPALVIFRNGEPIEKAVGLRSKQVLVDKLNSLLALSLSNG